MGTISRPSYELDVDTHTITKTGGILTFCSVVAGSADATVSLYDVNAAGDIAATNKLVAFKVDLSLNGFQGGGNITNPIRFVNGLVVVVAGTGAVAYVGYSKG